MQAIKPEVCAEAGPDAPRRARGSTGVGGEGESGQERPLDLR